MAVRTHEPVEFSRPADELSCIVGGLFESLDPPCGVSGSRADVLTIFGRVRGSGERAVLRVLPDRCIYTGPPEALEAVLDRPCPEKEAYRCER